MTGNVAICVIELLVDVKLTVCCGCTQSLNTLRPRQNGRQFTDDLFKCIFLNENVWISIEVSLKFVPEGLINNIPALVQIMAWRLPGDKPLSEPMMVSLPSHICVTRPQHSNYLRYAIPHSLPVTKILCSGCLCSLTSQVGFYVKLMGKWRWEQGLRELQLKCETKRFRFKIDDFEIMLRSIINTLYVK